MTIICRLPYFGSTPLGIMVMNEEDMLSDQYNIYYLTLSPLFILDYDRRNQILKFLTEDFLV